MGDVRVSDAPKDNIVDRFAPERARPFLRMARIDRPIGWWLLLLPCWWSSALAAVSLNRTGPDLLHLLLLLIGAVAMRGAGSVWNDIVDRDLDGRVERTRSRPLPSGAVTVKQAAAFMALLCCIGLLVLLSFNRFAVLVGFCSLLPVVIYPFMKRFTNLPQVVLGLAFAWGGLMGWAALRGDLAAPAFLLYAAAIAWTFGYDTIYAMQDIEDDEIVGIGSTARLFGGNVRLGVAGAYGLTVLLLAMALWLTPAGWLSWAGLAVFTGHLVWQVKTIRLNAPRTALMLFRSNRDAGLLFFAGIALDSMLRL